MYIDRKPMQHGGPPVIYTVYIAFILASDHFWHVVLMANNKPIQIFFKNVLICT